MAVFCYRTDEGELIEKQFRCGNAPKKIRLENGKFAKRSFRDEWASGDRYAKGNWPLTCCASGVNAEQAGELRDFLQKSGVPTEVTPDGDPVYRSASHRKEALKARGMFDRNGFI